MEGRFLCKHTRERLTSFTETPTGQLEFLKDKSLFEKHQELGVEFRQLLMLAEHEIDSNDTYYRTVVDNLLPAYLSHQEYIFSLQRLEAKEA